MKTITTEGKKSLSLLLIFAIIIGLLPPMTMPVWAEEGTPPDNHTVTMSVYGASITADTLNPIAGENNLITLKVKDSDGNADTTFSGTTDLTITGVEAAPKGSYGRLNGTDLTADAEADPGQTISVTFNEGQATANLSLHKAGNQTITFHIAGVTEPATKSFDIQPAAPATMTLTTDIQAPTEYGGEFARQPVITLQDAYGNRCTNDNTTQVTAYVKDTGDWTLTGTTTITAANGQANFTNLGAANIVEIANAQIAFNLTNSISSTTESNMALLNASTLPQVVTSAVTLQPWESTLGDGVYIEQISAGSNHSLALTSTGVVYAWGYGVYGQLGDGVFHSPTSHTSGMVLRPVKVLDGAMGNTGVTAISASDSYSVALKDGVVYAWGWGVYGRLGNGSTNSQNTPVKVSDGEMVNTGVTAIAAGEYHTLAIKNHQIYAWGYNEKGVLGIGEYTNPPVTKDTPVKVLAGAMGPDEKVIAIAASIVNSLALTETGVVYAWGSGQYGQLGNGSDNNTIAVMPVKVLDGDMGNTGVEAIAAGTYYSVALKDKVVYAWGWGNNGELGNGKNYSDKGTKPNYFESTPVKVSDGGDGQDFTNSDVTAIAVGRSHSLAIKGGSVYAWGVGSNNRIGNNSTSDQTTPVKVWAGEMETNENVTAIAAGNSFSLAIKDKQAYAWGPGGLIGNGTFNNAPTPVRVAQHADWGSTITIADIPGVTPPVTGAMRVTTITETTQYTGTVIWSPTHNPFQAGTIYTATITITPKNGYTLNGVTANFFKVAGATATHDANTGVVTAVFPATSSPSTPGTGDGPGTPGPVTPTTYTLAYHPNGGTGTVAPQTTNVGTATTVAANTFTRTGYTFTGWNRAANGTGTAYAQGASLLSQTAGTTVTLYAQWQQTTPPAPTTYTVAYHPNGGTGTVAPQTTNVGTATTVVANTFNRTGYTFTGWNTVANGTGTAYVAGSTVPSQTAGTTVTLYAQWTENTYSVSGTVNDHENNPANGASVKLMRGNTQIGTSVTTTLDGTFTITDVPNGTYNLVVEKDGIIVTTLITVSGSDYATGIITLPSGKTNSIVDVKAGAPSIVVGGLDGQFTDDDKDIAAAGGTIEIKFTAQKKAENDAQNANDIKATASNNGKKVGIFLDLTVTKTVTGHVYNSTTQLIELQNPIDVLIPLDEADQNKSDYVVYRYHGTSMDTITTTENADGEKIELIDNGKTIKLTIKKFSTYAIAYTVPVTPPSGTTPGDSDNSNDNRDIDKDSDPDEKELDNGNIIIKNTPGGTIEESPDSTDTGTEKTFLITPDEGYVIADILVDGKSVGAAKTYTFKNLTKEVEIQAVFVKATAIPYHNETRDKDIFIGYTRVKDGIMTYIAPQGVTVLFKDNPKYFNDISRHAAIKEIDFVAERNLFVGTAPNVFSPEMSFTRAMFVTVIGKLHGASFGEITESTHRPFTDVAQDSWYNKYVTWAEENNIVRGVGGGKFEPERAMTRQEMTVIMDKYLTFIKVDLPAFELPASEEVVTFIDQTNIAQWAAASVQSMQQIGMIETIEEATFNPEGIITRAQAVNWIYRLIHIVTE